MSAHTANSQLRFQLPSLSYVDAKWEEPSLRAPAAAPAATHQSGLFGWLSRRVAHLLTWRRDSQAMAELSSMTDYELRDIGLNRADLPRVFQRSFNEYMHRRGARL